MTTSKDLLQVRKEGAERAGRKPLDMGKRERGGAEGGKGTVSHVKMSQTVEFSPWDENGMPDGCRGRNSDEEQMEEVEEVVETVEGIA